jgi:hypothetical protein
MIRRARREHFAPLAIGLLALVVVGAAVIDTLRKSAFRGHPAATSPNVARVHEVLLPERAAIASRLRRADVSGVLYFVDRSCHLRALRLPTLDAAPAPRDAGCRALVSPSSAPPGWSLWPRNTPLAARCDRTRVIVSATAGPSLPMIGGCAPAWKPDGSMTYVRRGAIVQFPRTGRAKVLRTEDQFARAIEGLSELRGTYGWRPNRIAWLGSDRFAAVAGGFDAAGRARSVLAVFSGQRVVAFTRRVSSGVTGVRASPRGNYLVLRAANGLRVYDAGRPSLPLARRFARVSAVAWSSDESWLALAKRERVVLQGPRARVVLPLRAIDLAWTRTLT